MATDFLSDSGELWKVEYSNDRRLLKHPVMELGERRRFDTPRLMGRCGQSVQVVGIVEATWKEQL